jgi:hypothetical protein
MAELNREPCDHDANHDRLSLAAKPGITGHLKRICIVCKTADLKEEWVTSA